MFAQLHVEAAIALGYFALHKCVDVQVQCAVLCMGKSLDQKPEALTLGDTT